MKMSLIIYTFKTMFNMGRHKKHGSWEEKRNSIYNLMRPTAKKIDE